MKKRTINVRWKGVQFWAVLGALVLGCPAVARAYLDPATGGYFAQVAIASFLAAAFTLRRYLAKIGGWFSRWFRRGKTDA